ncbi:MAG: hypothetical protein IJZ35_04060 [Clostridia bacterium]|nr:hypothetical protein [Clostridia bacterium]
MMNSIKHWAILLCVSCITSALMYYLLPDGKIRKSAHIAFSLFMMMVAVSIFSNADFPDIDIDYSENIIQSYDDDLGSYIKSLAEAEVVSAIEESLESVCTADYDIDTFWQNEDNTYQLSAIVITISQADTLNIQSIKSVVSSVTGIIPEVQTK